MRIRSLFWFLMVTVLLVLALGGCSRDSAPSADADTDVSTDVQATTPDESSDVASTATLETPAADGSSTIVATVNSVSITDEKLDRSKRQVLSRYQQIYSQFGMDVYSLLDGAQGRVFELQIEDEALELATTRTLIAEELQLRGASVTDDAVEEEFQRQYEEFLGIMGMTDEEFQEAFASGEMNDLQVGDFTYNEFVDYARMTVREDLEIDAIQTVVTGPIEVTEDELRAYFEENRASYEIEEQVTASHILVSTEEEAQQLLDQLAEGADFATLAQEHSIDTASGIYGGSLGAFTRGQMVEEFENAAFSTPVGEISGIVASDYGFHIIWVTGYQAAESPEYEDVAEDVLANYEAAIRSERFGQWYNAARPLAEISIQDPMLNAFRLQNEDIETGLNEFVRLQDEGLVDEPYLDYVIGNLYETLMEEAEAEKQGLESAETISEDQQVQIEALEARIEALRQQALAEYQAALETLGEDAQVQARIDALTPAETAADDAETESQTTDESATETTGESE